MANKFKIGDYVIGNHPTKYNTTCMGWRGKVTDIDDDLNMRVINLPGYGRMTSSSIVESEYFDLCDAYGTVISTTKGFRKGDLVTGTPNNSYGILTKDFVGEVMADQYDYKVDVQCIKPCTGQYEPATAVGFRQALDARFFMAYYGDDPRKKVSASAKKAPAKQPQAFMEGVDVRIEQCDGYYDITTDEYVGEVGNIAKYLQFREDDGCWLLSLKMEDGETLDVLECELVGYHKLSKPKSTKVVTVAPVGLPYTSGIGKSYSAPMPSSPADLCGNTLKNPCEEIGIKNFDITNPVEKTLQVDFKAPSFRLDSSKHKEKVAKVAF